MVQTVRLSACPNAPRQAEPEKRGIGTGWLAVKVNETSEIAISGTTVGKLDIDGFR